MDWSARLLFLPVQSGMVSCAIAAGRHVVRAAFGARGRSLRRPDTGRGRRLIQIELAP
jgi:hypothetical protein